MDIISRETDQKTSLQRYAATVGMTCTKDRRKRSARAGSQHGCLQLPGFGEIGPSELTRVPRGYQLDMGSNGRGLMVAVAQGLVKVTQSLPNGRCQIIALVHPGELIMPPTIELTSPCAVEAAVSSMVFLIDRTQFDSVRERMPELELLLAEQLQTALARAYEHLVTLGRKRPIERLASLLIELAQHQEDDQNEHNVCSVPLLRADIADYLGLESETISRLFSQLKIESVIDPITPSLIRVLDWGRIEQLANCAEDS